MIISRYFLGIFFVYFLSATVARAIVDTSGMKYSAYVGTQNTAIPAGSFTLEGNETDTLVPNHTYNADATYGLGAAYRYVAPMQQPFARFMHDISVGLDMYYFRTSQRGDALAFSTFNDFDYQLKIQNIRLMANMEWTFPVVWQWFYPFLEGGIGISSNKTTYTDVPNANSSGGIGIHMPNDIVYQFAYDFGAGVKTMVASNIEISVRYLYTDLGAATAGDHASLPVTSNLGIPLAGRTWMLGLSYLM